MKLGQSNEGGDKIYDRGILFLLVPAHTEVLEKIGT